MDRVCIMASNVAKKLEEYDDVANGFGRSCNADGTINDDAGFERACDACGNLL